MNNVILYIDCDGVIFDTINTAYRMMDEIGLDRHKREEADFFFQTVDWNVLIYEAGVLNNAIRKIKYIITNNIFSEVKVLTKLSGNPDEERIKRIILGKLLPDVEIITLEIYEHKDEKVHAKGNVLVDDDTKNYERWNNASGIGVHYIQNVSDLENNIISDLLDIPNTKGVKTLLKRR